MKMNLSKKRWVRRGWLGLTTALATVVAAGATALSVSAAGGPPQNSGRPSIIGSPVVGKVLTARNGTWSGATPITFKYQWARCSATGTGCVDLTEAAQSQTYIATTDDLGHRLKVHVTATNSAGTTSRDSGLSAVIKAAPTNAPVNSTRPAITGSAVEGNSLSAGNGAWNGATPITYAYQWQRCDATGALCHEISDATNQTYSPDTLDVGKTLRVVVTGTNTNGSGASISHQSATIRSASSVTVTLNSSAKVVKYGQSVTLTGTVAGSSGDTVTILARPGVARTLQAVGTTTTNASGSFTTTVTPRMRTVYAAKALGAQSDSIAVNVSPAMRLRHVVGGMSVTLTAARSFVGRYVNVQAFVHSRWTTVKRVFLTRRSFGASPTTLSTANFRLSARHGLKLRAFLTLAQAGSSYTSALSNIVRS
jgi:hypothetical protein